MDAKLDILGLRSIPVSDGTLFLYPEYVEQTKRFDLNGRKEDLGGSRHVEMVTSLNEEPFVAKVERSKKDYCFKKCGGIAIQCSNFALREVSIARVLSRVLKFEDPYSSIEFEEPYGFHEDRDGKRTALFRFYNGVIKEPHLVSFDDDETFRDLEENRSREKRLVQKELEMVWIDHKYDCLSLKVVETYFPSTLSQILLILNGVRHNEPSSKFLRRRDPQTGKYGLVVDDFEFCKFETDPLKIFARVDYDVCTLFVGYENVDSFKKYVNSEVIDRRRLFDLLVRESSLRKTNQVFVERLEKCLGQTGYFEGRMQTFGPAYELMQQIDPLKIEDVILE